MAAVGRLEGQVDAFWIGPDGAIASAWGNVEATDGLSDPGLGDEPGGEYGPYIMARYTRKNGDICRIYYTLSTWNPYQVMVMRSDLKPK